MLRGHNRPPAGGVSVSMPVDEWMNTTIRYILLLRRDINVCNLWFQVVTGSLLDSLVSSVQSAATQAAAAVENTVNTVADDVKDGISQVFDTADAVSKH